MGERPRRWSYEWEGPPATGLAAPPFEGGRLMGANRVVALAAVAALAAWGVGRGVAPPSGPAPLTFFQRARLADLTRQADEAASSGRFAEAEQRQKEVVALRARWQGPRHWETQST